MESSDAKKFRDWYQRNGCILNKLEVAHTSMGFGLHAIAALEPNEVAASIPVHLLLTVAASVRSGVGQLLLRSETAKKQRVSAQALMYVMMIHGWHDPSSQWHEYLRQIPSIHHDPLWWTAEDRERRLKGTQLLYEVQRHEMQLESVYNSLFPELSNERPKDFPSELYSFSAFRWARSSLASRCFLEKELTFLDPNSLSPSEREQLISDCPGILCPLLDTANHCGTVELQLRRCELKTVHLGVSQSSAVDEGEEYFINYGNHRTNLQLLLGHGFCIAQNPKDTVPLKLGALPALDASKAKQDALRLASLKVDEVHDLSMTDLLPARLLALLRLVSMSEEVLKAWCEDETLKEQLLKPVAVDLDPNAELLVLQILLQELDRKIEALGERPAVSVAPDSDYYAALYRLGQLDILTAARNEVSSRQKAFIEENCLEEGEEEEDAAEDELLEDCEATAKRQRR